MSPMKMPEQYRQTTPTNPMFATTSGQPFGLFQIPSHRAPDGHALKIIACDGEETGWEHVSVSFVERSKKCPSWNDMCFVKNLFWADDACVVQFHPASKDYISLHHGCLHLWRSTLEKFPMPPKILV